MNTHEFRITLLGPGYYDDSERYQQETLGARKHVGTEDTAIAAARRTRVGASEARIERVALVTGQRVAFRTHEVESFTIELN